MSESYNLVLVTGASGWLGSNLVEALVHGMEACADLGWPASGVRVRCLVPPGEDPSVLASLSRQVEVVCGDVRRPEDCRRFCQGSAGAVLLHTAGVIHPRRVADFYRINVAGTDNLLTAAVASGVRRAVVVSSNSVCGCNPHPDHLFDEQSPPRPYLNYGRSKLHMEQLVAGCRACHAMETVVVRCPWFYGPNQPVRQTLFFRLIRDGKVPLVGDGGNLRSMVYVDNLCQGILRAAACPSADGQVYWIADAEPYSMNAIIGTIEDLLEEEFGQPCARRRLRLPGFVSGIAYGMDRCLQWLGLYHQKIHVLSEMNKTIACSIAKARRDLGYQPVIGLREGMRRSLRWALTRGALA